MQKTDKALRNYRLEGQLCNCGVLLLVNLLILFLVFYTANNRNLDAWIKLTIHQFLIIVPF